MRTTRTLAIAATCAAALGLSIAGVKLMTPTPAHADDAQVANGNVELVQQKVSEGNAAQVRQLGRPRRQGVSAHA